MRSLNSSRIGKEVGRGKESRNGRRNKHVEENRTHAGEGVLGSPRVKVGGQGDTCLQGPRQD